MGDAALRAAFLLLKPACVQLLEQPCTDNVTALRTVVKNVEPECLQKLQEYVVFPMRLILKQSKQTSQDFYTDVVSCLHDVLAVTETSCWELFCDVFNALCCLVSPSHPTGAPRSEEIKLATTRCLRTLIQKSTLKVLENMFAVSFLPALGHAVSILLGYAQNELMRDLRVEAMLCLQDLILEKRKAPSSMVVNVGTTMASFLPGISMSLCHVITGDTKQGHMVTMTAIETWASVVRLVLGDVHLEASKDKPTVRENISDINYKSMVVQQDDKWVQDTTSKLQILVKKIITVSNHPNWKVRIALVGWASSLLQHCHRSLSNCVPDLLQVLVAMVADDYPAVVSKSQKALKTYSSTHGKDEAKPLVEMLEDNLHNLCTRLPRLMGTADDDKKLSTLKLVSGYIRLLGPDISSLLQSHSHLKRLIQALTQITELDCGHSRILEERTGLTVLETGCSQVLERPKKHFKHIVDENIEKELQFICRLLGYYGDLQLLVDHLSDLWDSSSLHRKQCILVINHVILGTTEEMDTEDLVLEKKENEKLTKPELIGIISSLLELYLTHEYWDLPTSIRKQKHQDASPRWQKFLAIEGSAVSVTSVNSNLWQICLLLEGIGNFAKVIGRDFQDLMMDLLYPVLEKLGEESVVVSHSAYLTLLDICHSCGYSSIEDLVYENADYLINSISLRLRRLNRNPKAPSVLRTMILYSGPQLLPLVDDTINEIISGLDQNYDEQPFLFMRVLYALVTAILQWFPPNKISETKVDQQTPFNRKSWTEKLLAQSPLTKDVTSTEDITKFFLEYHKLKQRASGNIDEEELTKDEEIPECNATGEEDMMDEEKKTPPQHIQVVQQVIERCVHVMSSPDSRVRILILDTVSQGAKALSSHKDVLLPLVHQLWPALVCRLSDEEQPVCIKAFSTVHLLCNLCGDFLYRRMLSDVLPKTYTFLEKQALISVQTGQPYRFTQAYKYQLVILQKIGELALKICLQEEQLDRMMRACLPYLSVRQPRPLQEACVQAFCCLMQLDPDAVWLMLRTVYCPIVYSPPGQEFLPVKIQQNVTKNEFSDNINQILPEEE